MNKLDENSTGTEKHWLFSIPKYMLENKAGTSNSVKGGISKISRSKSCFKKSNNYWEEEVCKNTKSIDFEDNINNIFESSLKVILA